MSDRIKNTRFDMSIKAIETVYNGQRFRSRLEAKWSLFLDELGVSHRYEPNAFNLNGQVNYLPDFYIDDWQCWLEVKGPEPTNEEQWKAYLLSRESGDPVIIAHQSFSIRNKRLVGPLLRVFYGTPEQLFDRHARDHVWKSSAKGNVTVPLICRAGSASLPTFMLNHSMRDINCPYPYEHSEAFYKDWWDYLVEPVGLGWINVLLNGDNDQTLWAVPSNDLGCWPVLADHQLQPYGAPQPSQVLDAAKIVMQHRFYDFKNN